VALGGTAESTTGNATAYVDYAYGVDGDITGDLSGDITVTAIAGTAEAPLGSATAYAYAAGVDGNVDGTISGTITVRATAGLENGVTGDADAYGIYASGGNLTLDNATIFAKAYEDDGTWIADNSYAIYNAGAINFIGGVNELTGNVQGASANISDGATANFSGLVTLSGNLDVGTGSTIGLTIGQSGGPTVATVGGTATFNPGSTLTLKDTAGALLSDFTLGQVIVSATTLNGYSDITIEDKSIFDFTVDNTTNPNEIVLTGVTVAQQNSPATGLTQAGLASAAKAMGNVSTNLGTSRSALRGGNSDDNAPQGPSGPPIKAGKLVGYITQYNDIGGQDSEGAAAGYDWQSSGYALGIETLIQDNFIIGFAAGQAFSSVDGKRNTGDGDSEMFHGTLYGTVFEDDKYYESGVFYGQADNDTNRVDIGLNGYRGNYDSSNYGAWFETGFTYKETADSRIEPYARASYVASDNDGFTDAGGPVPMTVASSENDSLIIEVGTRYTKTKSFSNGTVLHAKLDAGIQAQLLDSAIYVDTVIAGTGQRVGSPESDPIALVLGLGLDWDLSDQLTLSADYEPTISCNWYNHSMDFTLRYEF